MSSEVTSPGSFSLLTHPSTTLPTLESSCLLDFSSPPNLHNTLNRRRQEAEATGLDLKATHGNYSHTTPMMRDLKEVTHLCEPRHSTQKLELGVPSSRMCWHYEAAHVQSMGSNRLKRWACLQQGAPVFVFIPKISSCIDFGELKTSNKGILWGQPWGIMACLHRVHGGRSCEFFIVLKKMCIVNC